MRRAALGRSGEERAAFWLREQGYALVEKNWRLAGGEIDLLMVDPDGTLVLVEVKTRAVADAVAPGEKIDGLKRSTLSRLAHAVSDLYPDKNVRVDAVEVVGAGRHPKISHLLDILN